MPTSDDDRRADEALAPFFAAARERNAAPRPELTEAILADALRVRAERARPGPAARSRRLGAIGGWLGAAALAASVAAGFAVGATGFLGLTSAVFRAGGEAPQSTSEGITGFFDMASTGE